MKNTINIEELISRANAGDIDACYRLACIYWDGVEMEYDPDKAADWAVKAEEAGHTGAKTLLDEIDETFNINGASNRTNNFDKEEIMPRYSYHDEKGFLSTIIEHPYLTLLTVAFIAILSFSIINSGGSTFSAPSSPVLSGSCGSGRSSNVSGLYGARVIKMPSLPSAIMSNPVLNTAPIITRYHDIYNPENPYTISTQMINEIRKIDSVSHNIRRLATPLLRDTIRIPVNNLEPVHLTVPSPSPSPMPELPEVPEQPLDE